MTDKEMTVLGRLTPQDYLQFMQAVWAQVTVLTPREANVKETFSRFSGVLNELEVIVVQELKPERKVSPTVLLFWERLRKDMDEVYWNLIEKLNEQGRVCIKSIFNELTKKL